MTWPFAEFTTCVRGHGQICFREVFMGTGVVLQALLAVYYEYLFKMNKALK